MDEFDIRKSLGYKVSHLNALLRNGFNKIAREQGFNVSVEQWGVLHLINNHPGMTQSEIASNALKDKTNVTRMLDTLQKNGYIVRKSVIGDRRSYHIWITEKGKQTIHLLNPIAEKLNHVSISGLSKKENIQLHNYIDILYNTILNLK